VRYRHAKWIEVRRSRHCNRSLHAQMRSIGHPDFQYTPWSAERRAAASKAARARIMAAKSNAKAKVKNPTPETKPNK
jgi:hypothetical protein